MQKYQRQELREKANGISQSRSNKFVAIAKRVNLIAKTINNHQKEKRKKRERIASGGIDM